MNNRKKYIKICENCKKEFHPFKKGNRFCSRFCFIEGYKLPEDKKRYGIKNPMWGKKRPKYIHDILLKANLGSKHSPEHIEKIRRAGFNRKHTLQTRFKMSLAQRGKKGSNWQGGKTEEGRKIRTSAIYKLWRETIFKRDNWTCVFCGKRNGNGKYIEIHPDHIKPFSLYPELRFNVNNGRTLCSDCHKKTSTYGWKIFNHSVYHTL